MKSNFIEDLSSKSTEFSTSLAVTEGLHLMTTEVGTIEF